MSLVCSLLLELDWYRGLDELSELSYVWLHAITLSDCESHLSAVWWAAVACWSTASLACPVCNYIYYNVISQPPSSDVCPDPDCVNDDVWLRRLTNKPLCCYIIYSIWPPSVELHFRTFCHDEFSNLKAWHLNSAMKRRIWWDTSFSSIKAL